MKPRKKIDRRAGEILQRLTQNGEILATSATGRRGHSANIWQMKRSPNFCPNAKSEFEKAAQKLAELKAELEKAATEFETASKSYDRERHLSEKAALAGCGKTTGGNAREFEHGAKTRKPNLTANCSV